MDGGALSWVLSRCYHGNNALGSCGDTTSTTTTTTSSTTSTCTSSAEALGSYAPTVHLAPPRVLMASHTCLTIQPTSFYCSILRSTIMIKIWQNNLQIKFKALSKSPDGFSRPLPVHPFLKFYHFQLFLISFPMRFPLTQ